MDLALRLLVQAQLRVLARTPDAKLPTMALEFARVRDNLNHYRNLCSLRELLAPRRH